MINKVGKVLLIYLLGMGMFLSATFTLVGDSPSVDINLNPLNPTPKSVVTFSVDINDDSISTVRLLINECNKEAGVCHMPQNISMNKVDDDTYETEVQLEYDDATSITYHIAVKSDGKWTKYNEYTTYLSIKSENDSNGSPGFETITFLIAMMGFLLLFKRFKSK